jgi:hypothetical protein
MHTPSRLNQANEDPDDEDDDTPGGNPPDNEGGDSDDEPDHDDEDDGLNAQDCIFMRLSKAINNFARNNHHTSSSDDSKVKVRKPDTFDGSKPRKLCTFFVQCELNFQSKPKTFHLDQAKVNFAQSYLKGMALKWFEPDLLLDELILVQIGWTTNLSSCWNFKLILDPMTHPEMLKCNLSNSICVKDNISISML